MHVSRTIKPRIVKPRKLLIMEEPKRDQKKPPVRTPASQDPRRKPDGTMRKGVRPAGGRRKGKPNRTTTILKDAILQAATLVGRDGKGQDGLVGYLMMIAMKEKAVYCRMLEKVLPLQLHVQEGTKKYNVQEAIERLRERNIPVPPSLTSLAGQSGLALIAHGLNDQHGTDDPYDNRMRDEFEDDLGGDMQIEDGS